MIKHVVCYKFKEEEKGCLQEAKELFCGMKEHIAGIISVEAHIDEAHTERSFDLILELYVNSFNDLKGYKESAYHINVVKPYMHSKFEKSVSIDYTLEETV